VKFRELDVSGPTSIATVKTENGSSFVRLYVREDGVVVAVDMLKQPESLETTETPEGETTKKLPRNHSGLKIAAIPDVTPLESDDEELDTDED
jgi:hypothetical protein